MRTGLCETRHSDPHRHLDADGLLVCWRLSLFARELAPQYIVGNADR
jgi:hypothetical protein